jgi:succinyl-CoA synthetase beta subunit
LGVHRLADVWRLKISRLLTGFRGGKSADMGALAEMLAGLARAYQGEAGGLEEVEINPLFVCEDGVWAVDALVRAARP